MEASHQATDDALDAAPDAAFRSKLVGMRNDVEWVVVRHQSSGSHELGAPALAASFYKAYTEYTTLIAALREGERNEGSATPREPAPPTAAPAYEAFAKLKEVSGRQRAFVIGALALPAAALESLPARAFTDLVLGLEVQRECEVAVRAAAPAKLHSVLTVAFELPSALADVHAQLESRCFDGKAIKRMRERVSAPECWEEYEKVLHAIEQALHVLSAECEERETRWSGHGGVVRQLAEVLLDDRSRVSIAALTASIEGMAADTFKAAALQQLALRAASQQAPRPSPRRMLRTLHDEPDVGWRSGTEDTKARVIALSEVGFQSVIGQGAEGTIYLATCFGATVAVKVASGTSMLPSWKREAATLTRLDHPNVLRCLGVLAEPPTHGLVLEYCSGRDLSFAFARPTPPGFVLTVATDVSAGMRYVHSCHVVHRDLKGTNVLVDDHGHSKITDFGLAAPAPDAGIKRQVALTAETGTFRWMAPEVIRHETYSKPCDVYSFGMIFFELLTRQLPFADLNDLKAAFASGINGELPPLPDGTPPRVAQLLARCWMGHDARATFDEVHADLVGMRAELAPSEIEFLDEPWGHPIYSTGWAHPPLHTYADMRGKLPSINSAPTPQSSDRAPASKTFDELYNEYIC